MEIRLITSFLMIISAVYISSRDLDIVTVIVFLFMILVLAININCDKE